MKEVICQLCALTTTSSSEEKAKTEPKSRKTEEQCLRCELPQNAKQFGQTKCCLIKDVKAASFAIFTEKPTKTTRGALQGFYK